MTTISRAPPAARILKTSPAGPVAPIGFGVAGLVVMIVGANAQPSTHPATPAPAAQATGRQRREGSVPVGKSSTTSTDSPKPSRYRKPSQEARVTVRGKCARNTPKTATAYARPIADSSHPIGFAGRFQASSAPTVAKAPMNTIETAPFSPLPLKLTSVAGSG